MGIMDPAIGEGGWMGNMAQSRDGPKVIRMQAG